MIDRSHDDPKELHNRKRILPNPGVLMYHCPFPVMIVVTPFFFNQPNNLRISVRTIVGLEALKKAIQ